MTKLDFKQQKESKEILKILFKYLKSIYGPRCKTKAALCSTCKAWAIYDLLELTLP